MSTPRVIVVDDDDDRIKYGGTGWFRDNGAQDPYGNYGPTYHHTLHGTKESNSVSFSFKGTSVTVMGTTNVVKIDDSHRDPTWECFVDNVSIGASTPFYFQENNWVLCGKGGLSDSQHELSIKITITNGHTFYLDTIQFAPSPSDTYDAETLLVKNEDPGIQWSSGWGKLGSATSTSTHGSTARMNFVGTGLTWVGWIPKELPHAASSGSYSIDGGDPVSFALKGLPSDNSITQYNQAFFTTRTLPAGPHSILVTYEGDGAHTPLTLDFIYLRNKTLAASESSPPPTVSSGGTSSGTTASTSSVQSTKGAGTMSFISGSPTGSAPGSTPSSPGALNPDPSSTTTSSSSSKTPIGPIVGGVIGGIALLALIAALLYCLRRRSRERRELILPPTGSEMSPFPTGYATSQMPTFKSTSERSYVPVPQAPSSVGSYEPYGGYVSSNGSNSGRPGHHASESMSSSSAPSLQPLRKWQADAQLPIREVVRHEDSGVRLRDQAPRIVEEIPPMYTAS